MREWETVLLKENQMRDYDFKVGVSDRDFLFAVEKFEEELALKVQAGELKQAQADRAKVEFEKHKFLEPGPWKMTELRGPIRNL